jgi:hypothetical protein
MAISWGYFIQQNPLLFGKHGLGIFPSFSSGGDHSPPMRVRLFREHRALDAILSSHRSELGDEDYDKYRNHCLRVLTMAVYHLEQPKQTMKQNNKDDEASFSVNHVDPRDITVLAVALAYHDLGLWTARKLDYLQPSVQIMLQEQANLEEDSDIPLLTPSERETVRQIILQHHKYTPYVAEDNAAHADLVNAVRMADWADATYGIIRFGIPTSVLEILYEQLPELGFHTMLQQMTSRLEPDSWKQRLQILNIFKW